MNVRVAAWGYEAKACLAAVADNTAGQEGHHHPLA